MKKAVYLVATQYDNLGDLIINKCLIDELTKHVDLYVDTQNVSEEFSKQFLSNDKVKPLKKEYGFTFKNLTLLKYIFSPQQTFTYFFKSPGPIGYKKVKTFKDKIRRYIYNLIFETTSKKGIKSFVIGSEATFKNEYEKLGYAKFGKHFHKHLLRSKSNVDLIKSVGINNVEYIPDLCFLLSNKVQNIESKSKVGVSFRDLDDLKLNKDIEYSVKNFVDFYLQKGKEVVFFYQVDRDHDYTKSLFSKFKDDKRVSFREECLNYDNINIYADFESVISNRLHVVLLGFINNAITFPLINDNTSTNKIKGIYSSIGSTTIPYSILEKTDLRNVDSEFKSILEETKIINKKQYELCVFKIADLFSQPII